MSRHREHAKSSCTLTYALRRLCENHHLRIGIISGTDDLAKKFLTELKYELESNQEIIRVYNGGKSFVGKKWTEHEIVLADAYDGPEGISGKDASVFSVGRGSQISSRHCDLLIADDVESADSVKTETVRKGTREWWAREVAPVLSPGGKFIVVGTRKSFADLYALIISDTATWKTLDKAKSVWDENGNPIWPEMWDREALLKRKAELDKVDVLSWPQEYLNHPLPSETQMFHPESWPTYQDDPHGLGDQPDKTVLQFWDLAISEKTTADYTVGVTIAVDEDNNVYILELRRGHWDFNRTLAEIGAMGHSWPGVAGVGIEKVAYQAAAVQEAIRRTMLPILPVVPDKDKVTRARLLEARANASKVYRPYKSDWWTDFSTEASYFPDPGSHDDQIDALSSAVKMAGWSADSIGWAYNIWTCLNPDCKHMFVFEPGRICPQCGTKAPDTFINPETLSYGGLLEDLTPPVTLPALNPGEVPLEIHDVEVVPHGTSEAQIAALRQTVEQMGAYLIEREGRYFVSTLNPGFMRFALVEQGYVEKVLP
jgi:predicted phage terminase large subunit-like protein